MKHLFRFTTTSLLTQLVLGDFQKQPGAALPGAPPGGWTGVPTAPPGAFPAAPTNFPGAPPGPPNPPKPVGGAQSSPAVPSLSPGAPSAAPASPASPASAGAGLPLYVPGPPPQIPSNGDSIPAAQCTAPGASAATGSWSPFILGHMSASPGQQCPTDDTNNIHWFLDSDQMGCCVQNSYLTTASPNQYACCPCGSTCNGLPPPMMLDWSLNAGQLLINGNPFPLTPAPPAPTGVPAPGTVAGGAAGPGIYTTADRFGSPIVLPFVPTSTSFSCPNNNNNNNGNGNGCQTLLYGPNQIATIVNANGGIAQNDFEQTLTTATSVLYGTFQASQCFTTRGQTSCGMAASVFPTFTTYGVYTREGAAAPRATGMARVGGVVAGMVGLAAAVL